MHSVLVKYYSGKHGVVRTNAKQPDGGSWNTRLPQITVDGLYLFPRQSCSLAFFVIFFPGSL